MNLIDIGQPKNSPISIDELGQVLMNKVINIICWENSELKTLLARWQGQCSRSYYDLEHCTCSQANSGFFVVFSANNVMVG